MNLPPFNCPLSEDRAEQLYVSLSVNSGDFVLDAGCGRAEFLIKLVITTGCRGLGIDIDEEALREGRFRVDDLLQSRSIQLDTKSLRDIDLGSDQFAAAICLGSTHAFAEGILAYPSAIEHLCNWTRPNGILLIGECFWRKEPAPDYLKILGEPVGIYRTFDENIEFAEAKGLILIEASQSTEQEWDEFENSHLRRAELEFRNSSQDQTAAEVLQSRKEWYRAYEQWGHTTLGFGFYIFRTPE